MNSKACVNDGLLFSSNKTDENLVIKHMKNWIKVKLYLSGQNGGHTPLPFQLIAIDHMKKLRRSVGHCL